MYVCVEERLYLCVYVCVEEDCVGEIVNTKGGYQEGYLA